MKLLYFGRIAEVAETREAEFVPPDGIATIGDLIDWLATDNPGLGEALASPTVRAVIDDHYVRRDQLIAGVREVAFIPPVSGG